MSANTRLEELGVSGLGEVDEPAFSGLAERHRRELHVHCYRMLGSFEDAEDTVQETFLRAWRRRETFEGRSTFRALRNRHADRIPGARPRRFLRDGPDRRLGRPLPGDHRQRGSVDPAVVDTDFAVLERDGYVILEGLLSPEECEEIRAGVTPLLARTGRNAFEGHRTQRVYSVLNKTRVCDRLVDHPRVLALLDRMFLPNYLLSMLQIINITHGEEAQIPAWRQPGAAQSWR
ncbi:sigma factor [Streptomyces sp. NPDC050509]|uniref:sigma factor n=1 Tax=Streptomyces sp. NPDC050509 TaxID=3365620 RepID=UPI00378E7EA5